MIHKVLIANRGEIAVRIIRACREIGIATVAVYSSADASALHTQLADEAVCIGPNVLSESYLNAFALLSAAEVTGADAIHPGYGFLSENSQFVEMCDKCGVRFIGPDAHSMRLMGNKLEARKLMKKVGVPIIPGSEDEIVSPEQALELAEKLGYPVVIKASAGGGGRGIRVVYNSSEVESAFLSAKSEAVASFGDGTLYMEKCITDARHIEVQILVDEFGNAVHLFERECSLQRRNQKVMEEAPSPCLSEAQRKEMGEAAVRAAKAANYKNAGTIEFLLDKDGNYYFMELNARIQVEHPITEMITGLDIVKMQILIAAGGALPVSQKQIVRKGHAIECRINAEDASFRPCMGTVSFLHVPGGPGVRFDTMLYSGYTITPYFDSMIGKLIVHDTNREMAMAKMRSALFELSIEGVETNVEFQLDLLTEEDVISGNLDTGLVDRLTKV